ncbi:MAG: EAL domain-containing protein [Actinomycetota bacterium]|nr:EAL domain-containing protein [Actinomycetota bacterium]
MRRASIRVDGQELARVVRGEVAPTGDLSNEADAPFFAPTLRLPEGRVYQAAPYISPDTDEWVISNSTLLYADGKAWGVVHFEVTLESFRSATDRRSRYPVSIVDVASGRVVVDSERAVGGQVLGRPADDALRALVAGSDRAGTGTVDGERVAYVPVTRTPDNANTWVVVVSAPYAGVTLADIGPAPLAMALAAVLLLAFVGLNPCAGLRRLHLASLADELTGLPNRRYLQEELGRVLPAALRSGASPAVLLVDLDRFKEVNDTLGHAHGDLLLMSVAARLRAVLRESDPVVRLGGDEFAVLVPAVEDEAAAVAVGQRVLAALHEPFLVDGVTLHTEGSVGVALAPEHGKTPDALLRSADVAMYEAKDHGVAVVVYDPLRDDNTPSRLALLGDLRRALQTDDELVLHYQPKVGLGGSAVCGAEALVRWQHPERGLVPPAAFLPAAEGTGLILPLTLHTLRCAIRQAWAWQDEGRPVQVAVNLSPRCLLEPDLPETVVGLLAEQALPARLLRLEITESSVMTDPDRALSALTTLRAAGIALSIDDFGTGYSSMSYLKRLPVDELKIDRSFVMDMLADEHDAVLVRSSIDLGHNLGLKVVAEGVEDAGTAHALIALGCDVVQGFHYARPMPADAFAAWLTEQDAAAVR